MTDEASTTGDSEPTAPIFRSLEEFVVEFLAPIVRRPLDGHHYTWCPAWWKHSEAISRLNALWRAWEHLRLDPDLGMSTWWLYHADPHLAVLLDADYGPFAACSPTEGHSDYPPPDLPIELSPPGMWEGTAFVAEPLERKS